MIYDCILYCTSYYMILSDTIVYSTLHYTSLVLVLLRMWGVGVGLGLSRRLL